MWLRVISNGPGTPAARGNEQQQQPQGGGSAGACLGKVAARSTWGLHFYARFHTGSGGIARGGPLLPMAVQKSGQEERFGKQSRRAVRRAETPVVHHVCVVYCV